MCTQYFHYIHLPCPLPTSSPLPSVSTLPPGRTCSALLCARIL
jgi:hypothetical protein